MWRHWVGGWAAEWLVNATLEWSGKASWRWWPVCWDPMTLKCQDEGTQRGNRPRGRKGLVCLRNSKGARVSGSGKWVVCVEVDRGHARQGLEKRELTWDLEKWLEAQVLCLLTGWRWAQLILWPLSSHLWTPAASQLSCLFQRAAGGPGGALLF